MKKVYLDNASTTAMRPEVIAEMAKVMGEVYGNPSSTHSFGRSAKVALETARKTIAGLIGAEAREIIFTSGGTEADNWIIRSAVRDLKVQRIISSRIEHHAVLNTVEAVAADYNVRIDYVKLAPSGAINMQHLEELLQDNIFTLVALMHVNNETGTILNLNQAGELCRKYNALFFSDTIQSVGKEPFNLKELPVDFITASAHKFHGPKGIGFAYIKKDRVLRQMLYGGEQEKGMRAGTEAIHQVAGMAKALEVAYSSLETEKDYVTALKDYLVEQLNIHFPGYKINGENADGQFYNIINILLPLEEDKTSMILFNLDMKGIAVSRGSACQSGSIKPSHVLSEILAQDEVLKPSLRVSFSHYNTKEDIDLFLEALKAI